MRKEKKGSPMDGIAEMLGDRVFSRVTQGDAIEVAENHGGKLASELIEDIRFGFPFIVTIRKIRFLPIIRVDVSTFERGFDYD